MDILFFVLIAIIFYLYGLVAFKRINLIFLIIKKDNFLMPIASLLIWVLFLLIPIILFKLLIPNQITPLLTGYIAAWLSLLKKPKLN